MRLSHKPLATSLEPFLRVTPARDFGNGFVQHPRVKGRALAGRELTGSSLEEGDEVCAGSARGPGGGALPRLASSCAVRPDLRPENPTEWLALRLGWWTYSPAMPRVPGTDLGASPLAQFVVLPLGVLFWILPRLWKHDLGDGERCR